MNKEQLIIEITKELQLYNKVSLHTMGNISDLIDKYTEAEVNKISSKPIVIKSLPLLKTENHNEAGWIACLDGVGLVTQGKTEEEAIDELMISIKVKLLYDRKSGNVL